VSLGSVLSLAEKYARHHQAQFQELRPIGNQISHYRLDAVCAHLLEKAGDREAAVAHYRKAAARTSSVPERNYLVTRAARLAEAIT
jgi:predicted RNA polymerase sigma factor